MQPWQITTVWAWEKTVVMVKQPGHLTSMKKDRGAGTRVCQDGVRIEPLRDIRFLPARISYLELVLARLGGGVGVEKINGENLERSKLSACRSLSIDPVYHKRFNPRAAGCSHNLARVTVSSSSIVVSAVHPSLFRAFVTEVVEI